MPFRLAFLALPLCALLELGAHAHIRNRVPSPADYEEAGKQVRAAFRPGDAVAAAPDYIDPLVREALGDLIPLSMAGRPDLSAYKRLWVLSVQGATDPELPADARPDHVEEFGSLTLARYALPEPTMVDNLVERLTRANVEVVTGGQTRRCRRIHGLPEQGGALGRGTVPPADRFVCGAGRDRMVAAVVIEDLDLRPRYCVWQPAMAGQRLRVTFPNVPLAEQLVIDAGLYYEHERNEQHPDVTLTVELDGKPLGQMVHKDGEGFRRLALETRTGTRGTLTFETHSLRHRDPGFCWSASTRQHHAHP